jgi:hypothetical protein
MLGQSRPDNSKGHEVRRAAATKITVMLVLLAFISVRADVTRDRPFARDQFASRAGPRVDHPLG